MLAKPDGGRLREGPQWAYEYKLDGYRVAMRIAADGTTVLTSRNGLDLTVEFAELTGVLTAALRGRAAVLDGEVVVYNETGQIDFGLLQQRRGRFQKHRTAKRTDPFEDVPIRFLAFDLLQLDDQLLLDQPYEQRRHQLAELPMPDPFRITVVPSYTTDDLTADRLTPQRLLDRVAAEGHEGLVAKRLDSPYLPGKRPDFWCKHPLVQTREVIVCGWRPGQSGFTGTVGGLLLGAHDPDTGELIYIGDVGTGFTRQDRDHLRDRLQPLERSGHPFASPPPREDLVRARWVDPVLVGEVRFRQFTRGDEGRLRHTAWRGLRADRTPSEVTAPRPGRPGPPPAPEPIKIGSRVTVNAGGRTLALSNLDKPLYPDGTTKSEVIAYYSRIAPVLLPHLADRPVTFVRFPNGVHGQKFFQKNTDASAPGWLPTVPLRGGGSRRSTDANEIVHYPLLHELAALVWAANLAALELHVPQWTVTDGVRDLPNRLVFDLDPGPGTTIVDCCRVAERLHDVLVADGLIPVAATSGSKGMQIYAGVEVTSAQAPSVYAKAAAVAFEREAPQQVTTNMAKSRREGRVFIDWSQNSPAKTTISPYSLRGRDEPTVATPVTWDEVRGCRRAEELVFTVDEVLERTSELGDLLAPVLQNRAPLPATSSSGSRSLTRSWPPRR
ncbi:DNA ligase D [Lentzea sp. BCCO 10_0061]|uniref:DNA ligase (ATP) n=1 Tax=Lentzea sokolovensis TaxID=3095429 RepID=A0ABU4V9E7_9PSEU|nr:DNA ligase D [Lentzea sp. BCCO 10_0061]MDX8148387.1 DNA ligase D [Lentzea sp. BCCO 10_0061]